MTSILTSSKNDPYVFCSTLHGLSNAVYRFSMRCVVLEISGGGLKSTPPPPVLGWLRPPPVRGLTSNTRRMCGVTNIWSPADVRGNRHLTPDWLASCGNNFWRPTDPWWTWLEWVIGSRDRHACALCLESTYAGRQCTFWSIYATHQDWMEGTRGDQTYYFELRC